MSRGKRAEGERELQLIQNLNKTNELLTHSLAHFVPLTCTLMLALSPLLPLTLLHTPSPTTYICIAASLSLRLDFCTGTASADASSCKQLKAFSL